MTSKVSRDTLYDCVQAVLVKSSEMKRNFLGTVETQIALKTFDPQNEKPFSGNMPLKHIPRPKMQVCILGDQQHVIDVFSLCDEAKADNECTIHGC
ncbi:hypothetical protein WA026_004573 [Henosepilachna vigintioctopunctata]|uniref:Uncharacterized protein n=1 Tax=Henosepilachna vigintioctopunctata TaxID=420089 RepID=A0AAW1VAF5_9CUCU